MPQCQGLFDTGAPMRVPDDTAKTKIGTLTLDGSGGGGGIGGIGGGGGGGIGGFGPQPSGAGAVMFVDRCAPLPPPCLAPGCSNMRRLYNELPYN
jgi:hypothetical protein